MSTDDMMERLKDRRDSDDDKSSARPEGYPAEIWVVIDDQGQPTFSATWPEACHEHINEAIAMGVPANEAGVVRKYRAR